MSTIPLQSALPETRLLLQIDRTLYRLRPVRDDPGESARGIRLSKPDGTEYDVEQTPFGPTCDCPDFIFRREGLDPTGCKHIKALVAHGVIAAQVVTNSTVDRSRIRV